MASPDRAQGRVFALGGGFFALVGAAMLLVQAIGGEWVFNQGRRQKLFGAEFGSIFFAFGQVFLFVGLGIATSRRKRRPVFNFLAAANGLLVALITGAMMLQAAVDLDWSLTWELLVLWALLLVAGYALARRHPDYQHAELMPELPRSGPSAHFNSSTLPARDRFLRQLTREDWKWALIIGTGFGLLPVFAFGIFFYSHGNVRGGLEFALFAGFLLFSFFMVGAFGAGATLIFRRIFDAYRTILSSVSEEYRKFAKQIGGTVERKSSGQLFALNPVGTEIGFPYKDQQAKFQIILEGSGDTRISSTCFILPLSQPTDLTCRIYSKRGPDLFAEIIGLQDVRLGWPLFDDTFGVKTNNEYQVGRIVDKQVQEALIDLRHWVESQTLSQTVGTPSLGLRIEQTECNLRFEGVLESADKLLDVYKQTTRIVDRIGANL